MGNQKRKPAQEEDVNLEDVQNLENDDLSDVINVEELPDVINRPSKQAADLPTIYESSGNNNFEEYKDNVKTEEPKSWGKYLGEKALEHAPLIGAGALGVASGGLGLLPAIGLAGLGAAGGAGYRRAFSDDPKYKNLDTLNTLKDIGEEGALGAGQEFGGRAAIGLLSTKPVRSAISSVSGVPSRAIKTYLEDNPGVKDMYNRAMGNVSEAANQVREKISNSANLFRKSQNEQIGGLIKDSREIISPKKSFDAIGAIEERLLQNPNANREELAAINDLKQRLQSDLSLEGKYYTPEAGNAQREYLGQEAKGAYGETPIAGFKKGSAYQEAAKNARSALTEDMYSKIKGLEEPYSKLSRLHEIEGEASNALLSPKSGPNTIMDVIKNPAGKSANDIRKLQELIGENYSGDLEKLFAMESLMKPDNPIRTSITKGLLDLASKKGSGSVSGLIPRVGYGVLKGDNQ